LELRQVLVEASAPTAADDPMWQLSLGAFCTKPAPNIVLSSENRGLPAVLNHGVLADFAKGTVGRIRVTHYRGKWDAPVEIQERIRDIWTRGIDMAACYGMWHEPEFWNIQATIEFEDGKSVSLVTDGTHVRIEDRDGTFWFIRLSPAV
jgi:hypothetical protein